MTIEEGFSDRTVSLIGEESYRRLRDSRVLVVGLGGVGGYAVEMLARTGVGHLTLMDADNVAPSNLNRQIIAMRSTLGESKAELFRQRIADIDPEIETEAIAEYLTPDGVAPLLGQGFDFVIDAIDTVAPKVALISECLRRRLKFISSMGAGGRRNPAAVEITDLWDTREDGLARVVRQRLKKAGLRRNVKVVFSHEAPHRNSLIAEEGKSNKTSSFGTTAIVPSTFGIYLAHAAIESLLSCNCREEQ